MNLQGVFCPNIECHARGRQGRGNIKVYSQVEMQVYAMRHDFSYDERNIGLTG